MNPLVRIYEFFIQKQIIGPIIILVVGLLLIKIITHSMNKIFNYGEEGFERKRRVTIIELMNNIIKYFIYILMAIFILDLYGVDTKSIIASLGIAGVIFGFALQSTVEDLISGITIIMNNYFVIGDIVKYNDFTGEVIAMSLNCTKIRKSNGEVYIIANRNINSVINLSQHRAGMLLEIPTAYEEETEKVEKILLQIVEEIKKMPFVYKESKYLGIEKLESSAIHYSILIYCRQDKQWQIKRDIWKKIKITYEKEKIKIPYSQIEVHNGAKI
ncbi:MAG: mechanosensitive ion channel family protein [Bacilli bacterium]|jgi:small-conductance mechanosensitive channel|nr:mechanosensitive ion channel family protein [Bacilli bacterium]